MKNLLLSALIGITSLTAVGEAKADLSNEFNSNNYIQQACQSAVNNNLKEAFWVKVWKYGTQTTAKFYQVHNGSVYSVGKIIRTKGKGITENTLCNADAIEVESRLGKLTSKYYRGMGYLPASTIQSQWKFENSTKELVEYIKEDDEKVVRVSYTRYDLLH